MHSLNLSTRSEPELWHVWMQGAGDSRFLFLIMFSTSTQTFESSQTTGNLTVLFLSGSGVRLLQATLLSLPAASCLKILRDLCLCSCWGTRWLGQIMEVTHEAVLLCQCSPESPNPIPIHAVMKMLPEYDTFSPQLPCIRENPVETAT